IINQNYYLALLVLLTGLLIFNCLSFLQSPSLIGILPILFQVFLLFLLATKNEKSQLIIKYWIGFRCILLPAIKLGTTVFRVMLKNMRNKETPFEMLTSEQTLYTIALLIFGIIILILNKDFAEKMQ
ncbi:MAG: hypothetical protein AB8F74_19890, partial [Saprospiraceae bacterium]